MSMSKKHYIAAAAVFAEQMRNIQDMTPVRKLTAEQTIRATASGMAQMFREDNSRFNWNTFMTACALGETVNPKHVGRGNLFHYFGRKVKVTATNGGLVNVHYTSGYNSGPANDFMVTVKELQY